MGLVGLLVAPPDVAGLAAVAMAVAWLVPHGQWLLAAAAPAALLASRAGARPSLAWLVVLLLAADALARPAPEEGQVRSSG